MPTLLISLGTSPAIVPEAFLLPGVEFDTVHVLTTDSEAVDTDFVEEWFAHCAPEVHLTITRVAGFTDFTGEDDHFRFEEVLYRWWLGASPSEDRGLGASFSEDGRLEACGNSVCLAGGFKTMSAAMQKAAAIFGAAEVFHVLCDLPYDQQPKTAEEIESARANNRLHFIRLGPENGWPQMRTISTDSYPLHRKPASSIGCVVTASAPDRALGERLREIVSRGLRIADAWDEIASLPFSTLATWSAEDLRWLQDPLDPERDRDWIAGLPKIDLHCHLGGFATHGELLREVRAAAERPESLPELVEPEVPADWPRPTNPVALEDYMKLGDATGSALLRDPGCLRRHCELLYDHLVRENIVYAEIRCSPANYADPDRGRSPWDVLTEIKKTFDQCRNVTAGFQPADALHRSTPSPGQRPGGTESPGWKPEPTTKPGAILPHINLLIIGTRRQEGDHRTAILRHLMLGITAAEHWPNDPGCRVVGVDLAGFEDRETRAHYYREDFRIVHRAGLALTVHAGENDDSEGIWSAVFDLNTRRIGHALSLGESPELLRSVAERRIGVEMCPFANLQIKGFDPMPNKPPYPLKRYLDAGVPVTINTDNIGISAASLTENFILASRMCPKLTRMDVLSILHHAVEGAFCSHGEGIALVRSIESHLPRP